VTDWSLPRGERLLERAHKRAGPIDRIARHELLSEHPLTVARLSGTGSLTLEGGSLRALTVLEGRVALGEVVVEAGRTAAIPASYASFAKLDDAHAILAAAS
jgi:hypothetical protein